MILREARRFFRSSRLLGLSGIMVLALGIGASTFALALMLAFSSLASPGMRSAGYATIAEETEGGGSIETSWRRIDESRNFLLRGAAVSAYSKPISTTLDENGVSRPLKVAAISSGFFSRFTPNLTAGRDFTSGEENQQGKHVVILSFPFAVALYKSPANALERTIQLNGLPFEVIGVAPSGFNGMFGDAVEAWVPANCVIPLVVNLPPEQLPDPNVWKEVASFYGVAASDRVSSSSLAASLSRSLPLRTAGESPLHVSQGLTTDPVRDANVRKWLRLGLLLALFFTLVSGLNYCMLLLARTPRYAEEVNLKRALGASSSRLVTELIVGPAAMVGSGFVAACFLCAGGMILLSRISPFLGQLVRGSWHAAALATGMQLLFACMLTMLVALIPALGVRRANIMPRAGYTSTASRRTGLLLQIPVTFQIAFCLGTWILAGMIATSFLELMRVPLGYDPSHLTVVSFHMTSNSLSARISDNHSFPEVAALEGFVDQLEAIPGVKGASYATTVPFGEPGGTLAIQRMDGTPEAPRTITEISVTPGYLNAMGARLLQGEGLSPHGIGVEEILINRTLVRELWPNENPINRSVHLLYPANAGMSSFAQTAKVVGIIEDMRLSGYAETPEPTIISSINGVSFMNGGPTFVVNGPASLQAIREVAIRQGASFLPDFRVDSIDTVNEQAEASLSKERQRTYAALAGALVMALVAGIGLYGALAYYVGTRRRELAVRICLGASPWAIRKIVLSRAVLCATAAVLLCAPLWPLLAQLSANEYLGRVSWSTERAMLITLACVAVSLAVSLIPAAAAAAVSPAEVLKEQ